jgi:ribonuclease P/MRP protein subunit RPP1
MVFGPLRRNFISTDYFLFLYRSQRLTWHALTGAEKGKDALTKEARSVVEFSRLKRQSFKGIVDVVYGGEKPAPNPLSEQPPKKQAKQSKDQKRKASGNLEGIGEEKPTSKQQKKTNEKAKLDG